MTHIELFISTTQFILHENIHYTNYRHKQVDKLKAYSYARHTVDDSSPLPECITSCNIWLNTRCVMQAPNRKQSKKNKTIIITHTTNQSAVVPFIGYAMSTICPTPLPSIAKTLLCHLATLAQCRWHHAVPQQIFAGPLFP